MTLRFRILVVVALAAFFFWLTQLAFAETNVSQLKKAYVSDNEEYFGNKLPKDTEITTDLKDLRYVALTDSENDKNFRIRFNMHFAAAERFSEAVMLHEMCHIKTWNMDKDALGKPVDHGKMWKSCMLQLDAAGAFRILNIDEYNEVTNGEIRGEITARRKHARS